MLKKIFILVMIGILRAAAQNPSNITFPSPTAVPSYSSVDTYTRAATSINLQPGFVFGSVTGTATNLWNLNISSYPPYISNLYQNPSATPNYYAVNPGLEAAVTSGLSSVGAMGDFNYSIPLVCSPGTAGMEPELTISYNSNGANNWLGQGFTLNGISVITRIGKSVFYDGINRGVKFDSSDVFALDGTRLLRKSGTYGQNGCTYKTPLENYYTITSVGSQGSGPQYFTITTPEGMSMEYGKTASSKSVDKANTEVLAWYITKIYDAFGNYMTYSYTNTDGELLIDKIEYTGNTAAGLSPYNKMEFGYVVRSDANSFYVAGKEFSRKHLLTSVTSKDINNAVVRRYWLDYQYQLASLLTKITEVDAAGNALNPTFFDWTQAGKSVKYVNCNPITPESSPSSGIPKYELSIPADLNGDGKKDLLLLTNTGVFEALVKINTPGGCQLTPTAPFNFTVQGSALTIRNSFVEFITSFVFDEDDDDIDEVFLVYALQTGYTLPNGPAQYNYYIDKIKNTGGSFAATNMISNPLPLNAAPNTWLPLNIFNTRARDFNKSCYFLAMEDVTGDNLRDVLVVDQGKISLSPSGNSGLLINATNVIKTSLGDFDGDGVLDIYTLKTISSTLPPYLCEIYTYNPVNNSLNVISTTTINTGTNLNLGNWSVFNNSAVLNNYANASKSIDFGDFDGDGKTDLMYINYLNGTDGKAYILKSNGVSFLPDNNPLPVSLFLNGMEASFSAMDVNNDGTADLAISSHDNSAKKSYFDHYPSNGNFLTPAVGTQFYLDEFLGALADFDGDKALDYVHQSLFGQFNIVFNCYNQDNKKMVNHIFNIRDEVKITYTFLPGQATGAYLKTGLFNTAPAFKNVKPAIFVTRYVDDNIKLFAYAYQNSVFHRQGKGFLGFEKLFVQDRDKELSLPQRFKGSVSKYTYSSVFDDVTSTEDTETYLTGFTVDSTMTSSYQSSALTYVQTGSNRYLSSAVRTSKDYLSSTYNTQTTNFDNNSGGQVLNTTSSNLSWLSQQPINSVQQSYLYQSLTHPVNSSTYYKGLKITETRSANAASSTYVTDFVYNTSTGYLTSAVNNSNLPALIVTTTYSQFNTFGKALSTSVTAPDLALPRTSLVQYDATGRFVTQSTDVLGDVTQAIYEPAYGNVIQSTGITGLVSTFDYDGLGRPVKSTGPTGVVNTNQYEWHTYTSTVAQPPQQKYGLKLTRNYEANGSEVLYFDINGSRYKSESTGFGGNTVVTENVYDIRDQLQSSNQSHFLSQAVYKKNTYTYDAFDRPITVSEYNNSNVLQSSVYNSYNALSTNSAYNKGSVTTQALAGMGGSWQYTVRENNEAGQTNRVLNYENINAQQVVTYTFNQHGLPTQMTTAFPGGQGGATTSFAYDALGRQNSITDPSAGVNTTAYNSIGELTLSAGPNGQYSYAYDQLGRLLTRTGSGLGAYTYEYFTSGNGRMQLKKITGPSVLTEYLYDGYNRPIEKKESLGAGISARQFKSNYTYDKYSRPIDHTYPGSFKTTNEYDANGFLSKIKNNNTVLWELTAMKTPGLVESYNNSAAMATQISYDNSLNLQQISLGSLSTQSFSIQYSSKNMLNRTHQNFASSTSNNEGFVYDNFNRLTQTNYQDVNNNTTVVKHNFSYQPNGNLGAKSDCGTYVYGITNKPYQLTQIQNPTNNISLNTLNVIHNDLDKVSQITEAVTNRQFDFVYGNDAQRIKMDYQKNSQLRYTRYYQDGYDREETANSYKEWSYVYAPTGLAAVYYNNNGSTELLNVTSDHLGSPVLLSSQSGQVVEEYSFDAWGRRRNPANWSYTSVAAPVKLIRGYTGHEQLDSIGLINMNGRMYDPVMGRFVQPDPLVQAPHNLQNLNRYSYVLNNPLRYTDPSGYKVIGPHSMGVAPDPNHGTNSSYQSKPALYVDGLRVEGAMDYFIGGGGGVGIGVTQNFGVWTGNGLGQKNVSFSIGSLIDNNSLYKTVEEMVAVSGSQFAKIYSGVSGAAVGKSDGFSTAQGAAYVEDLVLNQDALDAAENGRNYGGDGSGGAWDNTLKVVDAINQFNPIANLMDVVSNAFTGADRFGNKMSRTDAWLKAASVAPLGKMANSGIKIYSSLTSKFGSGYKSISVAQGSYMNIKLGQKLNSISPGVWSKIYEAGILDGAKVETHYFYNATTGQYANPYIHHSGW